MEEVNLVDDFFGDQNKRYADIPASPIDPKALAKIIHDLHGTLEQKYQQNQSQKADKFSDLVSTAKSKNNFTIIPDTFVWREENKDNFKVDHFSEKPTREKFTALYNQKKTSKPENKDAGSKEQEVFEEIPLEVKYYDKCFLKMANIASIQGLEELFAPNFALNAFYFMTIADSPGYASYIISYCIKNLTSHIPVGWYFSSTEQKREIEPTKFCECAGIPEDDLDTNVRNEGYFDFSDEESLHKLVDPVIENTENEEGLSLLLITHTSHEKTIQLKEKEMQKYIFKGILAALYLLAENGHLILKFTTSFQRMSVELLFLLYGLFEEIKIVKLNASSPRKLERFVICTKFKQSIGREIREKMLTILPHVLSPSFAKEEVSFLNLSIVKTAPEFVKFNDNMNKPFMLKLIEKLNQPKTSRNDKVTARQGRRILGKWKLLELSASDISDHETDNRQNYRNRNQNNYRSNDSNSRPQRDYHGDFENRRRGRGNFRGNRGNRGDRHDGGQRRHDHSDDRMRNDRSHERNHDRPRYDRSNNDRPRHERSNDRSYDRNNRQGDRNGRPKQSDEERFKMAEQKGVRATDIITKELVIPSFDPFAFIGGKGGGDKKSKQK